MVMVDDGGVIGDAWRCGCESDNDGGDVLDDGSGDDGKVGGDNIVDSISDYGGLEGHEGADDGDDHTDNDDNFANNGGDYGDGVNDVIMMGVKALIVLCIHCNRYKH